MRMGICKSLDLICLLQPLFICITFTKSIRVFAFRNLQAAIGAYYDFESPNVNIPSMSFVEDVTIGEGESVPPDTHFTKTWRVQNTGNVIQIFSHRMYLLSFMRTETDKENIVSYFSSHQM